MMQQIALVAAVVLPLWNIPLIARIIKRKSSEDVSIYWALGVWTCLLLMVPSGLASSDAVWRVFSIANFIMFTAVVAAVLAYHKRRD